VTDELANRLGLERGGSSQHRQGSQKQGTYEAQSLALIHDARHSYAEGFQASSSDPDAAAG
jgi:hypothetical protein